MPDDDSQAELLRKFQESLSGLSVSDLGQLAGQLEQIGGRFTRAAMRPDLRHPRRSEVTVLRVRVDLDHAVPPIWRRLDLRSDLTLDVVHQVLQVAFDWTDSHLHRFALGGSPFDLTGQWFLCPFDVEEGEDDGLPAHEIRLDETLKHPGDVLRYVYDYGDSWELTLRLEEVRPSEPGLPPAVVVGGRRAAPPEDSGGGTDLAALTFVVDDPAHFDADELNEGLGGPYFLLRDRGIDPRLVNLVLPLDITPDGHALARRLADLFSHPSGLDHEQRYAALAAHRWFLDRAKGGGIELTSAGYLRPADVEAACQVVPAVGDWIGSNNRESHTGPLLDFRESLQSIGLLRKYKGTLLLTRAGAAAQRNPAELWDHLAARLVPARADEFETVATVLMLAHAATSPDQPLPLDQVAAALEELGWRHHDGRPLHPYELNRLPVMTTLENVADRLATLGQRHRVSPAAAALARDALVR